MIAYCFWRSWNELIWHWLVTMTQGLIFEASRDFAKSRRPFWMTSCDQQRRFKITDSRSTKYYYYVVSTVSVDGLAPLGTRTYEAQSLATIFSCDQAALRMAISVCLSVCLWHLFDNVSINVSSWIFQELLPMTKVMSMQKVKVRGQRSRSQRSNPNLTVSGL